MSPSNISLVLKLALRALEKAEKSMCNAANAVRLGGSALLGQQSANCREMGLQSPGKFSEKAFETSLADTFECSPPFAKRFVLTNFQQVSHKGKRVFF